MNLGPRKFAPGVAMRFPRKLCVALTSLLELFLLLSIKKKVFFFFKILFISKHTGGICPAEFSALGQRGSHYLLATGVEVQCMSLSRVWHNTTFLEIVGTLGMSLGISDLGVVSTFGL